MSGQKIISWIILAGFVLSTIWLQYCLHYKAEDGYQQIAVLQNEITDIEYKISEKRIKNKMLSLNIDNINKNPDYIESIARTNLYMIGPDEVFVTVD